MRVERTIRAALPAARGGLLLPLAAMLLAAACAGGGKGGEPPPIPSSLALMSEDEVLAWRAERDASFVEPSSPLPDEERGGFEGLDYFPFDPTVQHFVRIDELDEPVPTRMVTTEGEVRPAVQIGWVEVGSGEGAFRLQVYQLRDASAASWESLFLPFADATTGESTYWAGRYLELAGGEAGWYVLDFNLAYYPSCAYGRTGFSCPRTPDENRLPFEVLAGERGDRKGPGA